jgi:hypothetical protein
VRYLQLHPTRRARLLLAMAAVAAEMVAACACMRLAWRPLRNLGNKLP